MVKREVTIVFKGQDSGLSGEAQKVREGLMGISAAAGALAGTIGLAAGASLQEFGAFDAALVEFSAKSGIARDQLGELEAQAVSLAATTSQTPASVAQLAAGLLALGASADEVSTNLEAITKLSDLIGEDALLTGQVVQTGINIFGQFGETADGLADKISQLINTTAAGSTGGVGEFFQLFSDAAPLAVQAGVGFDELSAAFATLRDNGAPASVAATGLKNAMISLAAPTKQAEEALQGLGISFSQFTDAEGNLEFDRLIRGLSESLGDITDRDEKIRQLATIFGREAAPQVAILVDQVDRLDENLQSVGNSTGAVDRGIETLNQGFARQIELLRGVISGLATEFGASISVLVRPLVQLANTVISGFLALPAPIKQAVFTITGFAGIMAAAVATAAGFAAAQQLTAVKTTIATAATLADITAKKSAMVIETALNVARAVSNASLSKETALLALNTVGTKAAALAKGLLAAGIKGVAVATGPAVVGMVALAAKAALVVGAIAAVSAAFKTATAGNEFGRGFQGSINDMEAARAEMGRVEIAISTTGNGFSRIFDIVRDRGPIQGLQAAMVELQSAIFGTADANDRFGSSVATVFGRSIGIITTAQLEAQRQQIATAEGIERLASGVDDTIDLFGRYGQAIEGAERALFPEELRSFTEEAQRQAAALQQEIDVLEAQKGVSEEIDQQLQNEINTRQRLIGTLADRVDAQGGEGDSVRNATAAVRELNEVLKELDATYSSLGAATDRVEAVNLAEIAEQQAAGLITAEEAIRRESEATQAAIQERIENNRALLEELRAQAAERSDDPAAQAELASRIQQTETQIARDRRGLAQSRIQDADRARKAEEDAEKAAADAAKKATEEAKKALEERLSASRDAAAAIQTERERDVLLLEQTLRDSGVSQLEIEEQLGQARLDLERANIESSIALAQERARAAEEGSAEQRQALLEVGRLQNDLIRNALAQEQRLRDVQIKRIERQLQLEKIVTEEAEQRQAIEAQIADIRQRSVERSTRLLQAQLGTRQAAADLENALFDRAANRQQRILQDENATSAQRQAAAQRLLAINQQRAVRERAALEFRQEAERQQFELEQERDRLSAERAIREEEIALRRLDIQEQEILGELEIARIRGDDVAVAAAEARLRILEEQRALQNELIDSARQEADIQARIADEQRQTLRVRQSSERLALADSQADRARQTSEQLQGAGGVNARTQQAARQQVQQFERAADRAAAASQAWVDAQNEFFQNAPLATQQEYDRLVAAAQQRQSQQLSQGSATQLSVPAPAQAAPAAAAGPVAIDQQNSVVINVTGADVEDGNLTEKVEDAVFGALSGALQQVRQQRR